MASSTRPAIASANLGADIEQRLAELQKGGRVSGLHALLVAKGDRLLLEHYETGEDEENRGTKVGRVAFGPTVLHDLRSVSKSVVGLLYGIALAEGKVPPPEAKLYAQFPEYADLAAQPGRDRLTIAHVLSMTLGFEWDELTIPYGDPRNNENAMVDAPDRYRYILERPIVGEPGSKWVYCGGATALLGRLIAKGTGEKLLDYARRVLFEPLGFGPSEWTVDRIGEPHAASGLRLLPRDTLKVGQLVLADGTWTGRHIVPAEWVKRATTPVVNDRRSRSLRLSMVHRHPESGHASCVVLGQRHRLGRPALVRRAAVGPRHNDERRQLLPADHGAGSYRQPGAIRSGVAAPRVRRAVGDEPRLSIQMCRRGCPGNC
jgi:CubicO group peptidase (beta-lactamase class C family)